MTSSLPRNHVDHINGIRSDNRWCNLREATRQENMCNQKVPHINNKSGYLGVYIDRTNKFVAQIAKNNKKLYLGRFNTAEEAHQVYLQAKRKHHEYCTI